MGRSAQVIAGGKKTILLIFLSFFLGFVCYYIFDYSAKYFVEEKGSSSSSLAAVSFIVPHHLLAEELMEDIFKKVAKVNQDSKIEHIVLLSPNHVNLGNAPVAISGQNWKTEEGTISFDSKINEKLIQNSLIIEDDEVFSNEHGIKNILPLVAKYFPGVKTTNVVIKNGIPQEMIDSLVNLFEKTLPQNTLYILSSDFSHELEESISKFHDEKSIEVIGNFQLEKIKNLDDDFTSGLELVMKISQRQQFEKFNFEKNSSASEIFGKNLIGENTSYVTGFFSKDKSEKNKSRTDFLFFGDLMLDRYNREIIAKKGISWMTQKIKRLFLSQDFNIANLEGTITDFPSVYSNQEENFIDPLRFTFDSEKTKLFLQENRINLLNLGNNHINNFGGIGIKQTKENIEEINASYFGDIFNDTPRTKIIKDEGNRIAVVSFNQFGGAGAEEITQEIKKAENEADFVIIYAHWGTEYSLGINSKQKEWAHEFINAGADLVVGSHPHVIEPIEIYKNKAIFYSLGNFIFDQYESDSTRERLGLLFSFSQEKQEFFLVPIYLENNGSLVLADEKKRKVLLDRLAQDSQAKDIIKEKIKSGNFVLFNN